MQTTNFMETILDELQMAAGYISNQEAEELVNKILESKKIFVAGAGRSGLMARSFVMRLMHVGLEAYVVGETVTPNFENKDTLIICSGSGETKSLVSIAEKAKNIGGTILVITTSPESRIGQLADRTIKMPGSPKDQAKGDYRTIQPMGSLFEQTLLLFYDATILRIMDKKELDTTKMYGKHANLE
ncbi:6-phospho-3-hexuloisomerase [Cytobacillus sp. BC1816]|uniref:6-phospho-3-hexuloisomerase n=1 Tax=Cytobacillus sp. BC1816 TaxID=3440154 RepID=UPI003F50FE54